MCHVRALRWPTGVPGLLTRASGNMLYHLVQGKFPIKFSSAKQPPLPACYGHPTTDTA